MRELQRKLDHDIKLKEFFAIKGNHRVNAELEAREAYRKQHQQEIADKQLNDLQGIMSEIQVFVQRKMKNACEKWQIHFSPVGSRDNVALTPVNIHFVQMKQK